MYYEQEMHFLFEVFKKSHVQALAGTPDKVADAVADLGLEAVFGRKPYDEWFLHQIWYAISPRTMYTLTDSFGLCYIYLLLPETEKPTILLIGPYLPTPPSQEQMLEVGENNGVSPKRQRYLVEYYTSIPVLPKESPLFTMLNTFCERIWASPSFAIVDINNRHPVPVSPINEPMHGDDFDDIMVNMKAMEQRYAFENELIQAVTLGQVHKEARLLSSFSEQAFEKRASDPLRNAKNYGIIMNTLLRKAAENGGVHPLYLDRVSSEFAMKIEQLPSLSENGTLMKEMFRAYCRLVHKHSMKNYSPMVQRTILLIDSDLSANLSPQALAKQQNVTLGYLSTIFKKETGKTISEHIRGKRIKHATHLLSTTHLQVQTVALHCGIIDVQYFSKIFKKETGMTPKEYRKAMTHTP